MIIGLSQILINTADQENDTERMKYLRENTNPSLNKIIKMTFDPEVKFLLPKTTPPYKPSEFEEPGNLYKELKRIYLFVEGGNDNLTQAKREMLFISLLEFIDKNDAELILGMVRGHLPYKRLTEKFFQKALPEIFK